ncbi:MAG: patatin-like phospholipase family protein [Aliidongia sp.]
MIEVGNGAAPFKPPPLAELPPLELLGPDRLATLADELSWVALPGGQVLFQEGDPADSLYLVTTGVLGVFITTADHGQQLVAEIHAGETVGEMSMITGESHSATVVALRHCEFYQMPKVVFDRLIAEEQKFLAWINKLVVQRLHRTTKRAKLTRRAAVALIPLDSSVPIEAVACGIVAALKREGITVHRFEPTANEQSIEWFDELESAHNVVLYQAEPVHLGTNAWGRFCLRQTDRVVLIGTPGTALPDPLPTNGKTSQADLVIVESMERGRCGTVPAGARRFGTIHHLRLHAQGDLARLARHLAGRAVGLVLSGGAARGFAHIGAIRAWREAGLPIDRIGGTSMGAIIAAGVAAGWDDRELRTRIHQAFVRTNPLNDYTLPWIALFRGETVNRLLRRHFNETDISALWRPFFAVSTNLTRGGVHIHRHGMLWRALRASIAIPGVLPPMLDDNEVLVDGGVVNNFPVDIMAGLGSGPIIGINVGGGLALMPGSEVPLNRRGLMGFLRPNPGPLPGIVSVLSRVGTVSSTLQTALAQVHLSLLIEPAMADLPLLDWQGFDRAVEAGYRATRAALEATDLTAANIIGAMAQPIGG